MKAEVEILLTTLAPRALKWRFFYTFKPNSLYFKWFQINLVFLFGHFISMTYYITLIIFYLGRFKMYP